MLSRLVNEETEARSVRRVPERHVDEMWRVRPQHFVLHRPPKTTGQLSTRQRKAVRPPPPGTGLPPPRPPPRGALPPVTLPDPIPLGNRSRIPVSRMAVSVRGRH